MQITRPDETTVLLTQIDVLLAELLRRIPESGDPGDNAAARERFFSAPTHDSEDEEMLADWQEYVEPELARLFLSSREIIETDLKGLKVDPLSEEGTLSIPVGNLESWINGLNQARLAISARFEFTEEEMEDLLPLSAEPRAIALLQFHVYANLLHHFLIQLERD